MPKDFLQNFAGKIHETIPEGLKLKHAEINSIVKEQLENVLPNLKFAKQDEFEIQQKILIKTREEVDVLKEKIVELEKVIQSLQESK